MLETLGLIASIASIAYPPLLYVLPASTASKISLGVDIAKTIVNGLDKAVNTKGGLTSEIDVNHMKKVK